MNGRLTSMDIGHRFISDESGTCVLAARWVRKQAPRLKGGRHELSLSAADINRRPTSSISPGSAQGRSRTRDTISTATARGRHSHRHSLLHLRLRLHYHWHCHCRRVVVVPTTLTVTDTDRQGQGTTTSHNLTQY